jgi:hypothetical protein
MIETRAAATYTLDEDPRRDEIVDRRMRRLFSDFSIGRCPCSRWCCGSGTVGLHERFERSQDQDHLVQFCDIANWLVGSGLDRNVVHQRLILSVKDGMLGRGRGSISIARKSALFISSAAMI